jgi:glycosyltransferase involved in cell wall biosynthesis
MPKLLIWAPFRGNVGTVTAVKNYAKIYSELGYDVVFIELCDEWSAVEAISKSYKIVSLTRSKVFKNIGKSNLLRRRDYFIYQFLRLRKLSKTFDKEQPDLIISFLGIAPAVIANYFQNVKHFGSIQGFPRFLNRQAPSNLYYKLEDQVRKCVWKLTYNRLDKILCMTPKTARELGIFLNKDTAFIPNPLFEENNNVSVMFDSSKTFEFIFIGRNSYQKRVDIILSNFSKILAYRPGSRLHFFGDIVSADLILEFPDHEAIIREKCNFYEYSETFWSKVVEELNPVHLVASQWEDPGHAILEGLWYCVPTVFLNSEGDYTKFYLQYGAVLHGDLKWDNEILKNVMRRAADETLRLHLKDEVASQFTVQNVKSKLGEVYHV